MKSKGKILVTKNTMADKSAKVPKYPMANADEPVFINTAFSRIRYVAAETRERISIAMVAARTFFISLNRIAERE